MALVTFFIILNTVTWVFDIGAMQTLLSKFVIRFMRRIVTTTTMHISITIMGAIGYSAYSIVSYLY